MGLNRINPGEPECAGCKDGMEVVIARDQAALKQYGWYAHCVRPDPESPTGFNIHTHGLDLKGLVDFQIVCPLPPEVAHNILKILVDRALAGEKFEAGVDIDKVIAKFPVRLAMAMECDRKVWRVIMPDRLGVFGKKAIGLFPKQYVGVLPVG